MIQMTSKKNYPLAIPLTVAVCLLVMGAQIASAGLSNAADSSRMAANRGSFQTSAK